MKQKAFTLIELLVVVAIIGILAAVGVVAYSKFTVGANKATVRSQFNTFVKLVEMELATCQLGAENMSLMYKQEDTNYYNYSCNISGGGGRAARSGQLIYYLIAHAKNSAGGTKGGKIKGVQWLNPYEEGAYNSKFGKKFKAAWDPGNAFDSPLKGGIHVTVKSCNPICIILIKSQYDDTNKSGDCSKNCVTLEKEISDTRKGW